jgi:hypothetical protein
MWSHAQSLRAVWFLLRCQRKTAHTRGTAEVSFWGGSELYVGRKIFPENISECPKGDGDVLWFSSCFVYGQVGTNGPRLPQWSNTGHVTVGFDRIDWSPFLGFFEEGNMI